MNDRLYVLQRKSDGWYLKNFYAKKYIKDVHKADLMTYARAEHIKQYFQLTDDIVEYAPPEPSVKFNKRSQSNSGLKLSPVLCMKEFCCSCKVYIPQSTAFKVIVPGDMKAKPSYICHYCMQKAGQHAEQAYTQYKQQYPEAAKQYETQVFLKNFK